MHLWMNSFSVPPKIFFFKGKELNIKNPQQSKLQCVIKQSYQFPRDLVKILATYKHNITTTLNLPQQFPWPLVILTFHK